MTPEETLRQALLEDKFPESDEKPIIPIADPLKYNRMTAVSAWMGNLTGQDISPEDIGWQAEKDALAQSFFKMPDAKDVSDETVHDLIRSHIQTSDNATNIALNSALTGRPLAQTLNEIQALAGVSKTRGIRDRYVSAASSLYSDIAAKRNEYSDVINKVYGSLGEMLKKTDTDIGMTDAFNDAAERLMGVPAEDRRLVIEAIAATGNATAEERSSYLSKVEWRVNRMAETLGAASVSNLSNALESVLDLAAFGSGLADPRDVAGAAPEGNKSRELSLLAQQIRTAANEKLDPIKSNSWIGKQGLALADMATQSGVALVNPLAGFAVNLAYFNDTMGADAMTQNPGLTVEQADKITAIGAPVNAAIETITALIPFGKVKLPFVQKWLMAETASVGGVLRKFGVRAGFGTATEIGEEIAQAYVPLKIQELMGAMGQDMPAVDWERNMPKFADIAAEVWAPALVFSIVGAGAASINDINNGRSLASDLDLLIARGIAPETAAKIKEASDLGDYNKVDSLFREEFVSETKASKPDIQAATERLKARFKDQSSIDVLQDATSPEYTAKVIRTATGWQVQTGDGNVVTTETKEAADQIYSKIRQVGNQKEAEVITEILEYFYSSGMGRGAQVEMTGETVGAAGNVVSAIRRDAGGAPIAGSARVFDEKALEEVRAEAAAAGFASGTQEVFARINGSNEVFPQQVGDTAKGIWRILSLFESRKNATPQVATLLHEDIESKFALGLINKSWTVGDIQKAFAGLLPAFANITAPIVQTDEQIAKMSKSAQEAYYAKQSEFNWINNVRNIVDGKFDAATLRETFSEMYVRDRFALDRKGLPTGLPAGSISRGIEASIMGATTQEEAGIYKRFRAMFKAFSAHFKAVFKTVQTMVTARKEGKIGEDWDSFVNKVLGIDEVKQMESQTVDEVKAMLGVDEEVQAVIDAENMAFSISPITSAEDVAYNESIRVEPTSMMARIANRDGVGVRDNILYRKDRAYRFIGAEGLADLRETGLVRARQNTKQAYEGAVFMSGKSSGRYADTHMIELIPDNTWTGDKYITPPNNLAINDIPHRIYERNADGSYSVIEDTIGDQALLDAGNMAFSTSRAQPADTSNVTEMPDGAQLVGPTTFSIEAYHGTPHEVDRFLTSKIGTGEGRQAFGWGLYFAKARRVAEGYRSKLTERDFIRKVREVFSEFDTSQDAINALDDLDLSDGQRNLVKALEADDWLGFDYPHQAVQAALREPENFDLSPESLNALASFGNLYTVELLPDEEDFLDWDAPLSEQSEKVRTALEQAGITGRNGNEAYINAGAIRGFKNQVLGGKEASAKLAALGIPGIRYLDGGSRAAGEGTSNYVIFDENLVKIIEKNGQKVDAGPTFSISPAQDANAMPKNGAISFSVSPTSTIAKAKGIPSTITPEIAKEFKDRPIATGMADLTAASGSVRDVEVHGGSGYPVEKYDPKEPKKITAVWASMEIGIRSILQGLEKTDSIWQDAEGKHWALFTPYTMKQEAHKSNAQTPLVYFSKINEMAKNGAISSTRIANISEHIRKTVSSASKMPNFGTVDIKDFIDEASFETRADIIDELSTARSKDLGAPSPSSILTETRDPQYQGSQPNAITSLLLIDIDRLATKGKDGSWKLRSDLSAADFKVTPHPSYNTIMPGRVLVHFDQPIPFTISQPEMIRTMKEASPKSRPEYLTSRIPPNKGIKFQTLTADIINKINEVQKLKGSLPQIKAVVNAVNGGWKTFKEGQSQEGLKEFTNTIDRSPAKESLTQYDPKDVSNMIKEGVMTVHQLGDLDVWFGVKKRDDGNRELVSVVNNTGIPGMLNVIMAKALEEGVNRLDASSVVTPKMPNGLLPTLYANHGWKESERAKYNRKYLLEKEEGESDKSYKQRLAEKEAALKMFWKEQGWDGQAMPDIVFMEHDGIGTGTIEDTAGSSVAEQKTASSRRIADKTPEQVRGTGSDEASRQGSTGGESGIASVSNRGVLPRGANSTLAALGNPSDTQLEAIGITRAEFNSFVQKSKGSVTYSISPVRNLNELSDQVERQFAENPVGALEVKSRVIRQFAKLADKWSNERWTPQGNKIRPISEKRTVKSLDKEQAMRQATLEGEKIAANMEPKQALKEAKAEAQAWRDETDAMQKEDWSPKESLVRDLITLEAIRAVFPQEIRDKIGGFVALARKASESARLKVLQKQLERGQVLLEKHLKEQYGTATEELLKRFKSQKDASGRITGKIISTATEQVDWAAAVMDMTIEQQSEKSDILEKIIEEPKENDNIQDALNRLGILRLFEVWDTKDSAAREAAFNWLAETIEAGKLGKSIMDEARKEMLTEMRQSAQSSILQGDELNPDVADNITNLNKGVFKRALLNLRGMLSEALWTTIQRLELIFGEDSKIVNHFAEKIINAANLSTDIKRLVEAQKKDALSIIFNSDSKYAHARGIAELQKMKKSGISTRRVKKEEIKLDLETLTKLNDGTMTAEAAGLRQDEVDAALEEFAANARKSTVTIERVVNAGTPVERMISETQGIQWWLWSMQDASRKQMERDGWDADSFKQLEEFLSPEAKALGRWISGSYQDAAGLIDPIYRKLFNAPLPRTKNYSPIHRRNMNTGGDIMDIDGSDMNSGLAAGFTKARVNTTASLVEMDALAVFLAHWENVSHWVSHAELMRDMKAVLLDKDTAVAIRQKKSEGYLQRLKDDVKTIEKNGTNSANELVNISRVWRWFMQYRSYKGLAFRLSPIIKQTPALLNPLLADVPAHNYMMGMARAFIEPQTFAKEVSAMWTSDIIRRRIESGFSAESRVAMQGAGMTGSQAIVAMQAGMVPMGMVDGGWTALGAAISFDYYRRGYMRDNPQMTPEIADAKAIARVEKMIATSAQPSDIYARSLSERSGNPFMKSMSMFVSDQRKALAIELMAIRRLATGKSKNVTLDIQRAVVAHVVQAGVSQVMAVVIASLLGDDEDRDRELSSEQWALALGLGPVNGLFVFGRLIDKIGRGLLGLRVFPADDLASKVANDLLKGGKNMDDLFNPDDSDDFMDALDSASTAVGAGMSAAIGPVGGVIDVGANVAREARKIAKRLADQ